MSFTHTVTNAIRTPSGTLTKSLTYSASGEANASESVANGQTDFDIVIAIAVAEVESFEIVSSQDVLVQTNDGGSPDDSLTLEAGVPYIWNTNSYEAFALTADVTVFYITNASGSTAQVEIRCIQDATP